MWYPEDAEVAVAAIVITVVILANHKKISTVLPFIKQLWEIILIKVIIIALILNIIYVITQLERNQRMVCF